MDLNIIELILQKFKPKSEEHKRIKLYLETHKGTGDYYISNSSKYKENHLLFIKNFDVPFDNNSTEKNLRMIKTKTKISGGFKTENGAKTFAKIRSFITTCKLKTENIIDKLTKIFEEKSYKLT